MIPLLLPLVILFAAIVAFCGWASRQGHRLPDVTVEPLWQASKAAIVIVAASVLAWLLS